MAKKLRKQSFIGWTCKSMWPCWTVFNSLNLCAVIQKTKTEAHCRYDDFKGFKNIKKIKITIEELPE